MKKFLALVASLFAPVAAFAQTTNFNQASNLLGYVQKVLSTVIPIVITLGVIFFAWEVFQLVTASDEEERAKAKSLLIWCIIGIFLVVSIWGIVAFLGNTLGIQQSGGTSIPCIVDSLGNCI